MTPSPSFLGLPDRLAEGRAPRAVIFGAGHGSTYPGKDSSGYALAPGAIRAASQVDAALIEHWDFDLGGPLFGDKPVCCVDAGDIPTTMHDNAGNRARIEARTREVKLPATSWESALCAIIASAWRCAIAINAGSSRTAPRP